jgi:ABC-2 type transport system ATP-binding protein
MINLESSSRWYGQVIGLNDVTCSFNPGITALLGQNGAGKSTMLKLITGQLRPTTGRVTVFGEQPFSNPRVYSRIGYCPETDSFYEDMTGRQFVTLMARMAGIGKNKVDNVVADTLEKVGMADRCDKRIAGYSKGMRQRIKLAQALAHDPDVLILDEPLNGLDPVGRRELQDLLKNLAAEGKTVVISSHILHEVEQMTRHIVLLHRGRLLALGDVGQIRSLIDKHPHRVHVEMEGARDFARSLMAMPNVLSIAFDRTNPNHVEIETSAPDTFYSEVAELVLSGNLEFTAFTSPDNNLESVFRYLVSG